MRGIGFNLLSLVSGVSLRTMRLGLRAPSSRQFCMSAGGGRGFEEFGVNAQLLPALARLGFVEPTEVQRLAVPRVLAGEDTVLLGETGTGKTLAYTVPVLHAMLEDRAAAKAAADGSWRPQALVLQPNRELCAQVHSLLGELVAELPLRASSLVDDNADADADVLVATPAVALRMWHGPEWFRWVVLDEADALLAGSFKPSARARYPITELIMALKQRKRAADLEAYRERVGDAAAGGGGESGGGEQDARGRRLQAGFDGAQFVLVGATLPNAGTRNVERWVRAAFPDAAWLRTERAHREVAEVRQFFVQVEPAQRAAAMCHALEHGPPGRALVFANTLASAEEAYAAVRNSPLGSQTALFHKGVAAAERRRALDAFQSGELSVLVCTGLASRGIDFTDVAHVVQYEAATNVVEHMHRVGRTARNGKGGAATHLYAAEDGAAELMEGLEAASRAGDTIDPMFSRKRLLRKKLKRYGEIRADPTEAVGKEPFT